jgi:hypothetical protein
MNAAGTKKTPQDPRRNKKEADGAGSTHFDRLEKSGRLVRKKWSLREKRATAYKARESGGKGTVGNLEGQTDEIPTGPGRASMLSLLN